VCLWNPAGGAAGKRQAENQSVSLLLLTIYKKKKTAVTV